MTVAAQPSPPAAVEAVTVKHGGSSLTVTWPAVEWADSYHVTYSGDNSTSWQLVALEHVGTSITINNVEGAKSYLVGVRARNAGDYSDWTNSAVATFPVPDAVTAVTAVREGSSLTVRWPASAGADSYHVTYTDNNGASWQLRALEHSGTSIKINGVEGAKSYIVAVRSRKSVNNAVYYSNWTNSAAATFPVPDAVTSVTAVHGGSSLAVSWPASARAASYHVTYTIYGGDNTLSWQHQQHHHQRGGQQQDLYGGGAGKECRGLQRLGELRACCTTCPERGRRHQRRQRHRRRGLHHRQRHPHLPAG